MPLIIVILVCTSLILIGATMAKPIGWVVVILAVIALLLGVLGGFNVRVGYLEGEPGGAWRLSEARWDLNGSGDRDLRLPLNPSYYGG